MGHIKEPKGVDFIIKSDKLNEKARQEITAFIENYKKKKSKSARIKKKDSVVKP